MIVCTVCMELDKALRHAALSLVGRKAICITDRILRNSFLLMF